MKEKRISKGKKRERCMLNSGELVVQRLSSSVSGKAQKYSRVGPREFVPFPHEEITIKNIKSACEKHFSSVTQDGLVCDVVAGDQGPSCRTVEQLPDTKVIHVRFIENVENELDIMQDSSEPRPKRVKTRPNSFAGSPSKAVSEVTTKQYPKSLSISEMIKLGKKIEESQRIGLLKKIKRHLPLEERKLYYNALIKPVMMYGCTIWSSCSRENVERVYKLQKRAARVILDANTMERSVNLFRKLNWLPLKDEIKIQKCSVIFRRIVGESPGYVEKLLTRNVDLGNRFNRHSHINLVCPKYQRESEGGRTFMVTGTRLSNSIPVEVKKKNSLGSFKYALRKYFLDYTN